jgi:hypothetical protein
MLVALATLAGNAVVTAVTTDAWESLKGKFVHVLGRGNPKSEQLAEGRLEETREVLARASDTDLDRVRAAQADRWAGRLADFLEESPDAADELQRLVDEVQALPPGVVSAADHSIAAGRDMTIRAEDGSVAAGVIDGSVTLGPTFPGASNS